MIEIKAIPTEYRGHYFRSRLEAKWAAFFDLCGWPWEYEPIDLNGYIPDFVLRFYKPIIVEVKPVLDEKEFGNHTSRIERSGWETEALIVGAAIFNDGNDWAKLGILAERARLPDSTTDWNWADALFHKCLSCKKSSFHHSEFTFSCRASGCYEGDHFLDLVDYEEGRRWFAEASRMVQYNA